MNIMENDVDVKTVRDRIAADGNMIVISTDESRALEVRTSSIAGWC